MPHLLLVRGRLYDVSRFRHPGGSVLRTHAWSEAEPIDATNAFDAFHLRSPSARGALRALPSASAAAEHAAPTTPRDPAEAAYAELVARLRADGLFDPSGAHVAYRVAMATCLWGVGRACVMMRAPLRAPLHASPGALAWTTLGVAVMAVAYVQFGWIQHECGHKSFTGRARVDAALQTLFNDVLMGGSRRFWNEQHHSHHANTQNIEHDKDLKTMPLVAFDAELVRRKGHTAWTRRQHWLYWGVVNPVVWGVWSFVSYPRHAYRHGYLTHHAATKALCLATYTAAVWPAYGLLGGVCLFHAVSLVGTMLLLATFTVSHTTTDAYSAHKGWVRPASEHTVNVHDHWLTNWWMGYLNFQIEHHLFPSMPQFRQARVSRRYVQPFFQRHGLAYVEKGFVEANVDVLRNLRAVARAVAHEDAATTRRE